MTINSEGIESRELDEAVVLLKEWYEYWRSEDHMPAKLPNALHMRTALFLTEKKYKKDQSALRRGT